MAIREAGGVKEREIGEESGSGDASLPTGEIPEEERRERDAMARRVGFSVEKLPHTYEEQRAAEAELLRRKFAARAEALRDCLTTAQVAEILGLRRQTIHERYKRGLLFALQERGDLRFPAWQFDAESEDGLLAGVLPALAALEKNRVSPLGKVRWMMLFQALLRQSNTDTEVTRRGYRKRIMASEMGDGVSLERVSPSTAFLKGGGNDSGGSRGRGGGVGLCADAVAGRGGRDGG